MNSETDFDFLSGTVRVAQPAPEAWCREGLFDFFTDPNNAQWGASLCRTLYHETLHFWQLLGWGYVANSAAADWARIRKFEEAGTMTPAPAHGLDSMSESNGRPFSPRELMESAARFWDVHTRSPARIVAEEGLSTNAGGVFEIADPWGGGITAYTHNAFDLVMQTGRDCSTYARPYRWLLERVQGHSAFAVIMFPLCVHAAMGTPDPVGVFCDAIDLAWNHKAIRWLIDHRSGSIHADWQNFWPPLAKNVLGLASIKAGVVGFTSGFDVISRGALKDHPVFREYLDKANFQGFFKRYKPAPVSDHPEAVEAANSVHAAALENPLMLFALPGEPTYRLALARCVPPPSVQFSNVEVAASRPVQGKLQAAIAGTDWEDTFASAAADVRRRIRRFQSAEYAVSLGQPSDFFERLERAGSPPDGKV